MAPKRKSALSQNPFRYGPASSFDPTPSSVQFRDEKAKSDFFKNFSKRGVHSECRVILSDFSDTDPLSFTVGVGSHCVMSQSPVLLC